MEIGRVINEHYRLDRLIKQGRVCTVYQGRDKVLRRTVAIKAVPAQQVPVYRAAIRMTSHFSHPNIIGLYDLTAERGTLYIVQEYVEGDEFSALLQASPYEVADIGCQLCQALLYASSSPHPACHGDLTPAAVLRDRQGLVRVNNFALPSNLDYFENWSVVGSEGIVLSDTDLPSGQLSAGRHADDTRAVALLLYQLLAGRSAGATQVEPPIDGQLHFSRSIPAELCETIARAIIRSHPRNIGTVEALHSALRTLTDTLEPAIPVQATRTAAHEEVRKPRQLSPVVSTQAGQVAMEEPRGTGKALPEQETGLRLSAYWPDGAANPAPRLEPAPDAPTTVADVPLNLVAARQAVYQELETQTRRSPTVVLLLLGLVVFALFFAVGYFMAHFLLFH